MSKIHVPDPQDIRGVVADAVEHLLNSSMPAAEREAIINKMEEPVKKIFEAVELAGDMTKLERAVFLYFLGIATHQFR